MSWKTGVRFLVGSRGFFLRNRVRIVSGAHPDSSPVGTGALFPGVKQPGHEADQSPPFSAELRNSRSCASIPHMSLCTRTSPFHILQFYYIDTQMSCDIHDQICLLQLKSYQKTIILMSSLMFEDKGDAVQILSKYALPWPLILL
jgi:hypothetical protein